MRKLDVNKVIEKLIKDYEKSNNQWSVIKEDHKFQLRQRLRNQIR